MTNFDEHITPPAIGPAVQGRVRGRPRLTSSKLARRPRAPERAKPSKVPVSLSEWDAMNEPEYVLAWEQLRDWTSWLVSRYRLTLEDRLPVCWPQHPELIEELWALRAWRSESYGSEGSGQSAVYWHQALVTFLTHVSSWWAGGCRAGHASIDAAIGPERARAWAEADPLAGIPAHARAKAAAINVLTGAQMRALTNAGVAHPQHESVDAFTYYDDSWWAYAGEPDDRWFRADEADLAHGPALHAQSSATP